MREIFTHKNKFFKIMLIGLLMIAIGIEGSSQTSHQVAVTSNLYTPMNITINIGDKIIWTNTQGNHNVNAMQSTFPSNPESFGNNVASDWTFEHTFNTAGSYNYQCDPHVGLGMVGTVEVVDVSTNNRFYDGSGSNKIILYPNPTNSYLNISQIDQDFKLNSFKVYSAAGSLLLTKSIDGNSQQVINLSKLDNGLYIIELIGEGVNNRIKVLKN